MKEMFYKIAVITLDVITNIFNLHNPGYEEYIRESESSNQLTKQKIKIMKKYIEEWKNYTTCKHGKDVVGDCNICVSTYYERERQYKADLERIGRVRQIMKEEGVSSPLDLAKRGTIIK